MTRTSRFAVNDAAQPPKRGFATLARRISAYTSRALLSLLVVVAGIGFGRQVLHWWRDPPDELDLQPPIAGWRLDASAGHEVTVGDRPWRIVRQSFQGDAAAAGDALLAVCLREATKTDGMSLPSPGLEERRLLARLPNSAAAHQTPHGVSLYLLPNGIPMVVGARPSEAGGPPDPEVDTQAGGQTIATWGIAVPAGTTSWNLYAFRPAEPHVDITGLGAEHEVSATGPPEIPGSRLTSEHWRIPLPPGCRRLLEVLTVGGDTSIVFAGASQPEAWMTFYDRWASSVGLLRHGGWQRASGTWHATYRDGKANGEAHVDVHFNHGPAAQGRGLILLVPQRNH